MSGPVAIFPWGDVIEEFLDPLGLSAEDYLQRMSGGWLFGYVSALKTQGREAVIVYASDRVEAPVRRRHAATGAAVWLIPGRRSGRGMARRSPSLLSLVRWTRTPAAAFAQVLRQEGCSAILVQDYEQPRFDRLALLGRRLGLPVHATFQGGDWTASPAEGAVRPWTLRLADSLIVPSARERARIARAYPAVAGRLVDIPNPVDTGFWTAEARAGARAGLGIGEDEIVIANHGRIDIKRKGLDVLLHAWARLAPKLPRARLLMVGSGQDDAAFADRVRAAGVPVDWRAGYVTDPPLIRRILSAADVYVTLSRTEGMPVAPLEAMACSLPVVATDTHGLDDIFAGGRGSGGVLVPVDNAPAAAAALFALCSDAAARATLGQAARRRVEATYSVEAVGRGLAAVLERRARDVSRPAAALGSPALG